MSTTTSPTNANISTVSTNATSPVRVDLFGRRNTDSRRNCLVIYTGGTFGMTPGEDGALSPTSGFLEQKISEMDEFKFKNMPLVHVLEWEVPIDSSDMCPSHWGLLATQIHDRYWDYDGFVILHGTDTMAYTASALSFMLENLGKPVVLAGAMIPLHFPHSDARRNLIMSIMCAVTIDIPEVCIYSNDEILRGNRTTKSSNISVNAFSSPNFPILAGTGVETWVDHTCVLPHPRKRFRIFTELHTHICVFRLVPGFDDDSIKSYIQHHINDKSTPRALVFSLYGTGNAPLRKDGFLNIVKEALDNELAVAITTQCSNGRTQLDSYATGIKLLEYGVITTFDMTIEAVVTKLAYLLGKGLRGVQLKKQMEIDIRGELSPVEVVDAASEFGRELRTSKRVKYVIPTR